MGRGDSPCTVVLPPMDLFRGHKSWAAPELTHQRCSEELLAAPGPHCPHLQLGLLSSAFRETFLNSGVLTSIYSSSGISCFPLFLLIHFLFLKPQLFSCRQKHPISRVVKRKQKTNPSIKQPCGNPASTQLIHKSRVFSTLTKGESICGQVMTQIGMKGLNSFVPSILFSDEADSALSQCSTATPEPSPTPRVREGFGLDCKI